MAPLRSLEQSGISRSIVSWIVGLSLIAVVGLGIGLGLLHAFGLADWNKIQQARDVGKLGGTPTIPEAYQELIDEAAERCPEVPSRVLAAQIAVESGWQADAQSPAGAQGIAQFMPSTWRQYGLDANGDGSISRAEFDAGRPGRPERADGDDRGPRGEPGPGRGGPRVRRRRPGGVRGSTDGGRRSGCGVRG